MKEWDREINGKKRERRRRWKTRRREKKVKYRRIHDEEKLEQDGMGRKSRMEEEE